jgi:CubicO group peptidase (beta-lactamase class C family)
LIADGFITGLDDDICDVIPETWKLSTCRNPNYPNIPITWRMLVTHRSSLVESISGTYDDDDDFVLPSYGPNNAYQGFAFGNPTCPLEDVKGFYRDYLSDVESSTSVGSKALFDGLPIDWYEVQKSEGGAWAKRKPGARRQYSNMAVGYIAALVELATGESFEDFSQRRIFKPLGMSSTSWFRSSLPTETPVATPIYHNGRRFIDEEHYCFIDYASGQLYSTTVDLSIFLDSMLRYGSPTLWDESIGRASLLCQEKDASGKKVSNKNCEFGVNWGILGNWMKDLGSWSTPLNRYDWTNGGNHEGLDLGAHSQVVLLPKDGFYLAVLVNTGEWKNNAAHILIREFVNAIHADPPL